MRREHDLRRTFASVGSDLGMKGFVGELLGHAEATVTDIYTRSAAEPLTTVKTDPGVSTSLASAFHRATPALAATHSPVGWRARVRFS